jgi:hypothetical protein
MKKLLAICVVSLFVGMTAVTAGQDRGVDDSVRNRFVGAWRRCWLEQQGADGKVHRIDCSGLLVYTQDGHMSVQVMERKPQAQARGARQYSQGDYEAFYGTYELNESTHTFTFHVDGALVRALIGKDLPRAYEFSGKQLIVKSTRADEHWSVAWEHY